MKKLIALVFLATSAAYAGGPNFQQKDPLVQQEFDSVYFDLSNAIVSGGSAKTLTITTATITNLSVSSAVITNATVSVSTITNLTVTTSAAIKGTTSADNAIAGNVGQSVSSAVQGITGGATGVWFDMTSISLTAGDWDISANYQNDNSGATTNVVIAISTVAGNDATGLVDGDNRAKIVPSGASQTTVSLSVPSYRLSLSATTTVYLKHFRAYTGTSTGAGRISARRMR